MDKEVFYNLGRLSATAEMSIGGMKSIVLLFLTRHFVKNAKSNGKRLDLVDLLEPDALEKNKSDLQKLVKYIKNIDNFIKNKVDFSAEVIQDFAKTLGVNIEVECGNDIDEFLSVLKQLKETTPKDVYKLLITGLINIFFVCNEYIKYPIIDFIDEISDESINNAIINSYLIIVKAKKITKEDRKKLLVYTKSVLLLFNYAINNPVFDIGMSIDETELSFATSSKVVSILEEQEILDKISGNLRYRVYKYTRLLNLFE